MSIFNNSTHVIVNDVPYMPIGVITTVSSKAEIVLDSEGNSHEVSVQYAELVPLDNGIDQTLDADALNLENCIRNNFNLEPINSFSMASEAPENCINDVDVVGLSQSLTPKPKTTQNTKSEPIVEPTKTE